MHLTPAAKLPAAGRTRATTQSIGGRGGSPDHCWWRRGARAGGRGLTLRRQVPPLALVLACGLGEDLDHRLGGGRAEGARQRGGGHVADRSAAAERLDRDVVAHVAQRQLGEERDRHAGGHEALYHVVVVALEPDPWLEARGLAGRDVHLPAQAPAVGLAPGLVGQLLEADRAPAG